MRSVEKPVTQDFQFVAGNLALDFVNTVGNRLTERRDYFVEPAEVVRWTRLAGLIAHTDKISISVPQMEKLKSVREFLYGIFLGIRSGHAPTVPELEKLNGMLAKALSRRRLESINGRVCWDWIADRTDVDQILGPVLSSAADLLVSDSAGSLRQCEDAECGWLFLDRSQANRRRWCSMADCGNRAKARRFHSAPRNSANSRPKK